MKVVQIGTNRANDDLSNFLLSNYEKLEFGLFVEPFGLHRESIKNCYSKYDNIIIESIAIKTHTNKEDSLTIWYHTNEHPNYEIATCDYSHLEKHMAWCPHLQGGEVRSFVAKCMTLEDLFDKYNIYDLDLLCLDVEGIDAEILLTFDWQKYKIKRIEFEHLHLGLYTNAIKNMMLGLGYTQIQSLSDNDWAFEKKILTNEAKMENFPSVNVVSITESFERRRLLDESLKNLGIENYKIHIFDKFKIEDHSILSPDADRHILPSHLGPVTSHLKAIKSWYENTDEEYAIFFEDDVSFETIKYWNFKWDEFYRNLPEDWECVQLCVIALQPAVMESIVNRNRITRRDWSDWSCCAYLINRKHAKKLVENYLPENIFLLDYKGWDRELRYQWNYAYAVPTPETIVYTLFPENKDKQVVYTFPLFVENINFSSTWCESEIHSTDEGSLHNVSNKTAINWWKTKGSNLTLNDIRRIEDGF